MLNLVLIGLNHRTADVDLREQAAFHPTLLTAALQELIRRPGVEEALIFSTCNRVEILSRVSNPAEGMESMECFLHEKSGIPRSNLGEKLYRHTGESAVRHLFRVTSSLDSMILGEPQILGQVKSFYGMAVEAGTVGALLNGLLQGALHAAKRVRSETGVGEYSVSVSSAAVDLARKIFGDLRGRGVLVVGAGKMGELTANHLESSGAEIRVSNRRPETALEIAERFHGVAVDYLELPMWIARSEIIVTSTGASERIVDRDMARSVMAERRNKPIVFIDISVPRNVDPQVATIENVFYYDIDDLGAVVQASMEERRKEAVLAEKIIDQEVEGFCARFSTQDIAPVVVQLQHRIREICDSELERYMRKSGLRDPDAERELRVMVSRIAGKLAHPLITQLRNTDHDPVHQAAYLDTIKRIFKLQKESDS